MSHPEPQKPEILPLTGDMKDWACILVNRHQRGENIRRYSLRLALDALKPPVKAQS